MDFVIVSGSSSLTKFELAGFYCISHVSLLERNSKLIKVNAQTGSAIIDAENVVKLYSAQGLCYKKVIINVVHDVKGLLTK